MAVPIDQSERTDPESILVPPAKGTRPVRWGLAFCGDPGWEKGLRVVLEAGQGSYRWMWEAAWVKGQQVTCCGF